MITSVNALMSTSVNSLQSSILKDTLQKGQCAEDILVCLVFQDNAVSKVAPCHVPQCVSVTVTPLC